MVDSLSVEQLANQIVMLHNALEPFPVIVKQLKEVLALQWFIGTIGAVLTLALGLAIHFFCRRALKAIAPTYKFPTRWIWAFTSVWCVSFLLFQFIPRWIPIEVSESMKEQDHATTPR